MRTISTDAPLRDAVTPGDQTSCPVGRLIDHIVERHHRYAQSRLAAICRQLTRLVAEHGDGSPELVRLANGWAVLAAELLTHMSHEERFLFPWITRLASGDQPDDAPQLQRGDWQMVIAKVEHKRASGAMAVVRRLADDYHAPPMARAGWRACHAAIDELEADLCLHFHLEDEVLFPLARRLDRGRRRARKCARLLFFEGTGPGGRHGRTH
jgi:regulator of cell morphogenesis and NO signaling